MNIKLEAVCCAGTTSFVILTEVIQLKKYLLVVIGCFIFLTSACSQGEEDTEEYYGHIGSGSVMGRSFSIYKEENGPIIWQVGHKGNLGSLEENEGNLDDLANYAAAIHDGEVSSFTLFYSVMYLLVVAVLALYLYAKHRNVFKKGGAVAVSIAGAIVIYFIVDTLLDLQLALQDAELYYARLRGN